jgi:hypothetical protein
MFSTFRNMPNLRSFAAALRDFKPRLSTGGKQYHMDYTRRV